MELKFVKLKFQTKMEFPKLNFILGRSSDVELKKKKKQVELESRKLEFAKLGYLPNWNSSLENLSSAFFFFLFFFLFHVKQPTQEEIEFGKLDFGLEQTQVPKTTQLTK